MGMPLVAERKSAKWISLAGLMNGSRIAAKVTAGIRSLCAETALSKQSRLHAKYYKPMEDPENMIFFCYKSIPRKIRSRAVTPYVQVSFRFIRPFKGYRQKTGPRDSETDSKSWYTQLSTACVGNGS